VLLFIEFLIGWYAFDKDEGYVEADVAFLYLKTKYDKIVKE
jgi:hypothetical protein